jgi:outer membrane protein assembly factor BamB
MRLRLWTTLAALVASTVLPVTSPARADQTTIAGNNLRAAWDDDEPALTPGSVAAADFGRLWTKTLPRPKGQDTTSYPNQIYAQPLVAHGEVIVATEENQVDALDPRTGGLLWHVSLGPASTPPQGCGVLVPHIGITSTPVYDPSTKTVYVVTESASTDGPHLRLHALDVTDGKERQHWPVDLAGKADNSAEVLDPVTSNQRAGLLLLNGRVYVATASYCDLAPYVGFVVGVDTSSRAVHRWSDENGSASSGAGIWQSGGGPMSDGPRRIFVATGNGVSPAPGPGTTPPATLAESVVRLGVGDNGTMTAHDYFSPANNAALDQEDADLGSGSPVGLPDSFGTPAHRHLLVLGGKDGVVHLLDRDDLGGTAQGDGGTDNDVSSLQLSGVWGRAAVFDASSSAGAQHLVYLLPSRSPMHALQVAPDSDGNPTLSDLAQTAASFGYTSGSPVVTSTGDDPSTALVWLVTCPYASGKHALLQAFPAVPPSDGGWQPVFQAPLGTVAKFVAPAIDAGRVFVGTRDGRVLAFGAPTTATVTAPSTDFGVVHTGQHEARDVTITAHANTTVTSVSASGPFTVGTTTLPATLAADDTLTVPITFHPTSVGNADGILTVTVNGGSGPQQYLFSLNGVGAAEGLAATPAALGFGEVRLGTGSSMGVTIRNTGTSATTITAVTRPSADAFKVTGLPAAGTTLGAQQSLTGTVTFTPDASGAVDDTLTVAAASGSVSVALHGVGRKGPPRLTIRPQGLSFGNVEPGHSRTLKFTVTNTGKSTLTITKAPPPNPPFAAASPISEGQQLARGDALHVSVTFAPTSGEPATGSYALSSNDPRGPQLLRIAGNTAPWRGAIRGPSGCLAPSSMPVKAGTRVRTVDCARAPARFIRGSHGTLHLASSAGHWCLVGASFGHCNAARAQWTWTAANRLRNQHNGRCLQAGTPDLQRCRLTATQRWDLSTTYARRGLISVAAAPVNQVCLDARGGAAHVARCTARSSQLAMVAQQVIRISGRCLDTHGHAVLMAACAATHSQLWRATPSGELVNRASRQCLTDPHDSLATGIRLRTSDCVGASGQVWRLP